MAESFHKTAEKKWIHLPSVLFAMYDNGGTISETEAQKILLCDQRTLYYCLGKFDDKLRWPHYEIVHDDKDEYSLSLTDDGKRFMKMVRDEVNKTEKMTEAERMAYTSEKFARIRIEEQLDEMGIK